MAKGERMKEYICKEVPTENGGYLEIEKELIRCRDCQYFINGECSIYCLSSAYEETFCSYAEQKETNDH